MNVEMFSLCDAATGDGGKLNILGAFDTIWAAEMPLIFPQCAIALRIRFKKIEKGVHRIDVNIVNEDGKHVIPPMEGKLDLEIPPEQKSVSANLILNIQRLKIEKLGEYSIDLAIDGRQEASLPLMVRERPVHIPPGIPPTPPQQNFS